MKKLALAFAVMLSAVLPLRADEMGDDGLFDAPWMRDTFLDLREDLAEANTEGLRLMVLVEQRGCVYCAKMHREVFPLPEIAKLIEDNYFVVQLNMYGDREVTDFDGETLPEKAAAEKWGLLFTPTMIFLPEAVPEGKTAVQAAVAIMPGAFGKFTTKHLLTWVAEHGYDSGESFQRYHARKLIEEGVAGQGQE